MPYIISKTSYCIGLKFYKTFNWNREPKNKKKKVLTKKVDSAVRR